MAFSVWDALLLALEMKRNKGNHQTISVELISLNTIIR
jgi:hypothetical protein